MTKYIIAALALVLAGCWNADVSAERSDADRRRAEAVERANEGWRVRNGFAEKTAETR